MEERLVIALESLVNTLKNWRKQEQRARYLKYAFFALIFCAYLALTFVVLRGSSSVVEQPVYKNYIKTSYRVRAVPAPVGTPNNDRLIKPDPIPSVETLQNPELLKKWSEQLKASYKPGTFVVIPITGVIAHTPNAPIEILGSSEDLVETILDQLEIAHQTNARAVILDISSPGGEVGACEEIRDALLRLRHRGIPIIAFVRGIMASGAYYISTDANSIVAAPSAMVGSIGVLIQLMNFEDLAGKIGVRMETIKSSPMKDVGNPFRLMEPQERAMFQKLIDNAYQRFRVAVANGRKIDSRRIETVATGEIFTAARAKELQLVDHIGDLQTAVDAATVATGISMPEVVVYERKVSFWDMLNGQIQGKFASPLLILEKTVAPHMAGPRLLYQWIP